MTPNTNALVLLPQSQLTAAAMLMDKHCGTFAKRDRLPKHAWRKLWALVKVRYRE